MVTTVSTPKPQSNQLETGITLRGISWQTYQAMMVEVGEDRVWRIAYDHGVLEIRVPLQEHEQPKVMLEYFVITMADELNIEAMGIGALTLEREDLNRAIEPDSCFYIQNESVVRGKKINLPDTPPPDLAIESDYTSSSLSKFTIYASLGVPELWRYKNDALQIYQLIEGQYQLANQSIAFPFLPVAEVSEFIEQSKVIGQRSAVRAFKIRIQELIAQIN